MKDCGPLLVAKRILHIAGDRGLVRASIYGWRRHLWPCVLRPNVAAYYKDDSKAYRQRESKGKGQLRPTARAVTTRGIVLSLVAGLLMGTFYTLVAAALRGAPGVAPVGPYAVALFFAVGVLLSTVPANLLLMASPLDGKPPVNLSGYWAAPLRWHLAGLLGGAIWATGAIANFVASGAHLVGPAVSYSIGQGATMVSACCGVFVWHEFAGAPPAAKRFLLYMFLFFALGLIAVALAPLY